MAEIKSNNRALIFILVTVLVDAIGIGIIIPVLPKLIADTAGTTLEDATTYGGLLFGAYALMQFLFAPVMGGLSDRFGRRPVLLLSLFGMGLDYIFLIFAPGITWMVIGRSISGMFGASFTTAGAYIADISAPEQRAKNFGMIGAAFGLGFIIGPAIGGLVSSLGIRAPFAVSAILALANCAYGFFILKESLLPENRRPFDWKRANPLAVFYQLKRYGTFRLMIASYFLFTVANVALQCSWSFFTGIKFGWEEGMVGWSLVGFGVLVAVVQGGLTGVVVPKLGNRRAAFIGLGFAMLAFLGIALVPQGWMLFPLMIPFCLGGFVDPAVRASLSAHTEADSQGELQGLFASMYSLGEVITPVLIMPVYHYFISDSAPVKISGSPYLIAAALTLISIPLMMRGFRKVGE